MPVKLGFFRKVSHLKTVELCVETGGHPMTFFENSYEQVNGDGDSHLGTHGVLRCAVEGIDSQMLFDPFEEEFDIPAAAVKLGDLQRRFGEIVG
jgi:hypothetical protein